MTKTNHTPGPWFAKEGGGNYVHYIVDADGRTICDTDDGLTCTAIHSKAEAEANAHLIAAAPDLLDALRDAELALSGIEQCGMLEKARSAIAKAPIALADSRRGCEPEFRTGKMCHRHP